MNYLLQRSAYDIPAVDSFPGDGSALVFRDSDTPAPPEANYPPRPEWGLRADPRPHPRDAPRGRLSKSEYLKVDGKVVDARDGGPGYTGCERKTTP